MSRGLSTHCYDGRHSACSGWRLPNLEQRCECRHHEVQARHVAGWGPDPLGRSTVPPMDAPTNPMPDSDAALHDVADEAEHLTDAARETLALLDTVHLPRPLAEVAQPYADAARATVLRLWGQHHPQIDLALTSLLQGKDAAVRALGRLEGFDRTSR